MAFPAFGGVRRISDTAVPAYLNEEFVFLSNPLLDHIC
jgi:hypothetical protein